MNRERRNYHENGKNDVATKNPTQQPANKNSKVAVCMNLVSCVRDNKKTHDMETNKNHPYN